MYVYVCDMEWAKKQDFYLGYFFLLTKGGPYTAYIIKKRFGMSYNSELKMGKKVQKNLWDKCSWLYIPQKSIIITYWEIFTSFTRKKYFSVFEVKCLSSILAHCDCYKWQKTRQSRKRNLNLSLPSTTMDKKPSQLCSSI